MLFGVSCFFCIGRNNEYCWYVIIMGWICGCCGDNVIY